MYFMRVNYRPVVKMINYIGNITKTNKSLEIQMDKSKSIIKQKLLFTLLKGNVNEMYEFYEIWDNDEIALKGGYYAVLVASLPNPVNIQELEIKLAPGGEYHIYVVDIFSTNRVAFVISMQNHRRENVASAENDIHGILPDSYLGVGSLYDDILKTSQSFLEASMALENAMIKGIKTIVYNEELAQSNDFLLYYPKEDLFSLISEISIGNITNIKAIIEKIIARIKNNHVPLVVAKCVYYDIINTTIRVLYRIDKSYVTNISESVSTMRMIGAMSIEELNDVVNSVLGELSGAIMHDKKTENSDMQIKILEYIHTHYGNSQLSVSDIAGALDVSYHYLGRYFKNRFGQPIIKYLNTYRMERAKELLIQTDVAIKTIMEQVGYNDISNFYKKFKDETGFTPNEYRQKFKLMPE